MSRAVKVGGRILVGLVIAALLLIGTTMTVARTSWGAERLRRLALPRLNAALAGQLEVAHLRFLGDRLVLQGVRLSDPDDQTVAEVARLDVTFAPLQLLRRHLHLRAVTIDEPRVLLRIDRSGTSNLARALAPRQSRPREAAPETAGEARGPTLSIDVESVVVRGAALDLRDQRPDSPFGAAMRHIQIEGLRLTGGGRYGGAAGGWAVRLDLRGDARQPLRMPVALRVQGEGRLTARDAGADLDGKAQVRLDIGDSSARVAGELQTAPAALRSGAGAQPGGGASRVSASVNVEQLRVTPSLVRVLAPHSPLKAALTMSGRATFDGATGAVAADLEVAAAGTSVAIKGAVDVKGADGPSIKGVSVKARGIDLARLLREGPPSDVSFDLEAHGEGNSLATLRGAATLQVPPGRLGGYAVGPIRVRADADRGRYKVLDLLAVLPGVNITGAGEATAHAVAFRGAVEVRDLGATVRSLTAGSAAGPERASGRGRIEVSLRGDPRGPSLDLKGHLRGLAWQDIRVPALDLQAQIPDVREPLASRLDVKIPQAEVGARRFRGFALSLRAAGRDFDSHLSLAEPEALRVDAAGVWGPGRSELALHTIALRSRHATWRSAGSTRLVFGEAPRMTGLDLRAEGGQRLRADLEQRAPNVRADLTLSAVDLARLPESLLPPKLKLAGRLSGEVHVRGRASRPQVEARATLAEGRVGNVRDLSLAAEVRLFGGRASGRLDLAALGAKLDGKFDLPVAWPPPAAARLSADFTATNIDLQRVNSGLRTAQQQLASGGTAVIVARPFTDVRGHASARVRVDGTGAHPELSVAADVRDLKVDGTAAGYARVQVDAPARAPITARLELRQVNLEVPATVAGSPVSASAPVSAPAPAKVAGLGVGASLVTVRTGFVLGTLIHRPPSTKVMLATPVHVEAQVDRVPVGPLAVLAGQREKMRGTVSLDAQLDGTPETVRGHVALTLSGISRGRFPPTDGTVRLRLGQRDVHAQLQITRRGTTLLSLSATAGAPIAALRTPQAFADAPIELHAVLGPLDLQRVGLPPETDRQPARILKGRLRAQVDLLGTVRAPRLNFRADAADLRLDQTPIGAGVVLATYGARQLATDVSLVSANGGRLHAVASTTIDLGYPALLRGVELEQLPITARLDAKGFDLAGLSGATPGLRTVAGQIFASVNVRGTAADPRPDGRFEWKDGKLTITGMGEYRRIHLLAHGDRDHLVLDELRAESGGGRARVTGTGDHRPGQGYAVKATMDLDEFPAYVEGQALATLSLQAKAESQVSVRRVRAKVSIDSARLALSDAKRKRLQKLAPPGDVVLVDGGEPLNAAQARKLSAVTAALAPPQQQQADAQKRAAAAPPRRPAGVVVVVDAPRNLWVRGKDANVELGLQPGFRVEITDDARVFGQVNVRRGRVDVVGRRFDLKADSSARFSGPPDQPELNVSANHVSEQERITVLVTVKGSPERLQINISAPDRPDLTETQLYTLVVTGRLSLGGGTASASTPTDRAASLVGGLVAAQLQKGLSKKLPFDVLTIETGGGLGTARLEAGTYVTSQLYIGYVGRMGANPALLQNRNAVHLEYELTSRWSFQGEYGDAKTGSADVVWTNRY